MTHATQCFSINIITAIVFLFISRYSASACNFSVKIEQGLRNEGFHRNMTYTIIFDNSEDYEGLHRECILALEQTLPSGIYANPDELGDLRRIDRLNAIPKKRINIELPAEYSEPSGVFIISKVTTDKVEVWVPVHARYHMAAVNGGTFRNDIAPPKLYLRCPDQRLEACNMPVSPSAMYLCNGHSVAKCNWKEIPFTMMTDTLIWLVPVGNLNHFHLVAISTTVVVVVGSLYLLKSIHQHKVAIRRRRL
ncbi:uncharacterized protein LOC115447490 [Manduca sexta]|uniref:Phosphatidylinositol-glycan biosynthesis class X protein n=1 Tax=Manduca sexta TaxID=7130 RepID=A0A921ZG49_MANSE|nr:uncharacterized protein LOC115447490 [Manduca sexta]KAG6456384.1 hypothetical protein O3G_MSEX009701 [Manduca sexta]KAG6456385.1 hypothetical protein O3G_MSEX009701 [Manduca sexta]